jgi:hypothetical protein
MAFIVWAIICAFAPIGAQRILGTSLSPKGFPEDWSQLLEYFQEMGTHKSASVLVNSLWRDNITSSGQVPVAFQLVAGESALFKFTSLPVSFFSFFFRVCWELILRCLGGDRARQFTWTALSRQ